MTEAVPQSLDYVGKGQDSQGFDFWVLYLSQSVWIMQKKKRFFALSICWKKLLSIEISSISHNFLEKLELTSRPYPQTVLLEVQ